MSKLQTPRGTRDFLPIDSIKRETVFGKIRKVFEAYGYDPFETPAFEFWEILGVKCGEEIREQIYRFKDKGGRELGLRYDLTVPLARVIASDPTLPKPFKRYCISRVWRYERPQAGRFREFWQADADIVGSNHAESDAEAMAIGTDCMISLGLEKFHIRLNSRKILEGLSRAAGVPKEKVFDSFRAIDKLDKIGIEGVRGELANRGIKEEAIQKLLEFVLIEGSSEEILEKAEQLMAGTDVGIEGIHEIKEILELSRAFGIKDRIKVDLSLARGLDYYTGSVFEIIYEGEKQVGSLAGGGRYDDLVELYGGSRSPAIGISLGIERIIEILNEEGKFPSKKTNVKVFVAPTSDELRTKAIEVSQILRREGIQTEIDHAERKLKKIFEIASTQEIPFVVIVGPRELEKEKVTVRNMVQQVQEEVNIKDLPEFFENIFT